MTPWPSSSPPLTLRPNMLAACQQTSSTSHTAYYAHNNGNSSIAAAAHTTMASSAAAQHNGSLLMDSSHGGGVIAHGGGGSVARSASFALDVSDPNGNAMTLLRNVESVYFQSMTTEDEKNKIMREKLHAEDQLRRLCDDKDKLAAQLAMEKSRRSTDLKLSEELASNAILMKDILNRQHEVKRRHEADFRSVKELQRSSSTHRAVIDRLCSAVQHLKQKQADRRVIKEQRQALWDKAKTLKEQLSALEASAMQMERKLKAEVAGARSELLEQGLAKDREWADRLLALRSELEQAARDELVRSALREGAALSAMKSEVEEAEAEEARLSRLHGDASAAAAAALADARRQHEQRLSECAASLESARQEASEAERLHGERLAAVEAELAQHKQDLSLAAAEAEARRAELATAQRTLDELRGEAESQRRDGLAKAMAAMAEIATLSQKQDEVGGLDTYCFRLLLATSPPLGSPQPLARVTHPNASLAPACSPLVLNLA